MDVLRGRRWGSASGYYWHCRGVFMQGGASRWALVNRTGRGSADVHWREGMEGRGEEEKAR